MRETLTCEESLSECVEEDTILFIDEIHEFNKAQRILTAHLTEDGTVILIEFVTEIRVLRVNRRYSQINLLNCIH